MVVAAPPRRRRGSAGKSVTTDPSPRCHTGSDEEHESGLSDCGVAPRRHGSVDARERKPIRPPRLLADHCHRLHPCERLRWGSPGQSREVRLEPGRRCVDHCHSPRAPHERRWSALHRMLSFRMPPGWRERQPRRDVALRSANPPDQRLTLEVGRDWHELCQLSAVGQLCSAQLHRSYENDRVPRAFT